MRPVTFISDSGHQNTADERLVRTEILSVQRQNLAVSNAREQITRHGYMIYVTLAASTRAKTDFLGP
ncbi:hypothetical protein FJT64_006193 [Amphibalanus amphitrite]|uniref:Uncharacterized protein n=1 Tax=Amphibalanus amphitrite TaxID=1232801 RepID=A0A6A4VTR6_AMPAM|nr:hypothetical protein FJT64_006192 [Amphibalanus amphitrite]KAF0296350.1 hypothetical protein FJT64_006193 [Amphibalanus amphitrite]